MKNISRHDSHCAFCSKTYPDWKDVDADQQLVAETKTLSVDDAWQLQLPSGGALLRHVLFLLFIIKWFLGMAGCAVHKAMLCYTKQNLRTPDTWEYVVIQRMMDKNVS